MTPTPYTAVTVFRFSDQETYDEALAAISELAKMVHEKEPYTTHYAFFPVKDDKESSFKLVAFEQWISEQAFHDHQATEHVQEIMKKFGPWLENAKVTMDMNVTGQAALGRQE